MANYSIEPVRLLPYLPYGTELDYFSGRCYVSLVGFMFLDSRLGGIPLAFHQSFEEVNLRFYVLTDQQKRGVVFIKELVPKPAVTLVANGFYKEHYETCPMDHHWIHSSHEQQIEYRWKKGTWHSLQIKSDIIPKGLVEGSVEAFFTEHYIGCTKINDQLTLEYSVEHIPWQVYDTREYSIEVDFEIVYGKGFAFLNHEQPDSVFLAEGSGITLEKGRRIAPN